MKPLGDFLKDWPTIKEKEAGLLGSRLKELHSLIAANLPLESGHSAAVLLNEFSRQASPIESLKAGEFIMNKIHTLISNLAIPLNGTKDWKWKIENDSKEFRRELTFIRWKIDHGQAPEALVLIREWIINRVWTENNMDGYWLDLSLREKQVESRLTSLTRKKRDGLLPSSLAENPLLSLWEEVTQNRNKYAHAGFRKDVMKAQTAEKAAKKAFETCERNGTDSEFWKIPFCSRTGKKLLITGMGSSIGLLYSAILHVKPDCVIVVTSEQVQFHLLEVLKRAGDFSRENVQTLVLRDVFSGFAETNDLVQKMEEQCFDASEVVINLTGGTTCMQWVMQSAFEKVRRMDILCRRVAFIDRRKIGDQQANPFELGEMIDVETVIQAKTG